MKQPSASVGAFLSVVWTGSQFYALAGRALATSPDAATWTIGSPVAANANVSALAWSGTVLVAVGTSSIYSSP